MHNSFTSSEQFNFGNAFDQPKSLATETHDINGFSTRTNIPEGLDIFDKSSKTDHPHRSSLLPSAIETLPTGEYAIGLPDSDEPAFDRKITIIEDETGRYIEGMQTGLVENIGSNRQLMQALGYKFQQGFNSANMAPMPETLKAHAAKLGVDVVFFDDQGLIASDGYLGAFSRGEYPVATGNAEYYAHDTQDDHITAMVLGGEPLKRALAHVASEALATGEDLDNYADAIDRFTAYLRGSVAPTYNQMPMAYDRNTLQFIGQGIGMSEVEVDEIIGTARENAESFGMDTSN
jgi:hypothetical protein